MAVATGRGGLPCLMSDWPASSARGGHLWDSDGPNSSGNLSGATVAEELADNAAIGGIGCGGQLWIPGGLPAAAVAVTPPGKPKGGDTCGGGQMKRRGGCSAGCSGGCSAEAAKSGTEGTGAGAGAYGGPGCSLRFFAASMTSCGIGGGGGGGRFE
jgi:hypothetical protein